jgi:DNA ligase (NAD+)
VIASLGIPTCGPTTAKELTKHYHSIAELRLATEKELEDKVDDVGEKTAASIVRSFINEEMYNKLERVDSNWTTSAVKSNGMTVCITGSIPGWERSALKNAIEAIGYKTVGSVSAKTTIVIAGSGAGEKLAKAQKLKLRVLTTPEDVAALLAGQP